MSDALGALCCPGVSLAVTPAAVSPWRTIPTCLQRLLTRMSSWCSWMTPQTCPPCCGTISSTAGWSPTGGCWGQVSVHRRGRVGSGEAPGACRGGVQDWSQRGSSSQHRQLRSPTGATPTLVACLPPQTGTRGTRPAPCWPTPPATLRSLGNSWAPRASSTRRWRCSPPRRTMPTTPAAAMQVLVWLAGWLACNVKVSLLALSVQRPQHSANPTLVPIPHLTAALLCCSQHRWGAGGWLCIGASRL
jgi:hypothetical protein